MTLSNRQPDSHRPGQMTAAMRVGPSTFALRKGPRVLRVGVVQDGRMREERTLTRPSHVSVGTTEENAFLLATRAAPQSFRLFEHAGGSYHLNFTDEMRGRVALSSGLFELSELKAQAEQVARGAYRLALSDEARGKIVLGEVTFLFQFVERAPILPKAVLPAAVLRGAATIDWNSAIGAAFSFFVHFLILGAAYSDWADPVIDDQLSTAGLIDSLKNLPPPPPVEEKEPADVPIEPSEDSSAKTQAIELPAPKPTSVPGRTSSPKPTGDAALAEQLAQIDVSTLGALNNAGPATTAVLKQNEVAWAALDAAASSAAGVRSGSGPQLAPQGAPIRAAVLGDLRELGTKGRGPEGTGNAVRTSGPIARADLANPATSGGSVSNAARTVAGMRAGLRACYQRGLDENPDASGSLRLTIRVGAGGEVVGVSVSPSGNLPASVVQCVTKHVRVAQFDAPEGGAAVISVPVTFVKQ